MRFLLRYVWAAVALVVLACPARAAWHEARSKHFIMYSDDNPQRLQQLATRLEKFDRAVRVVTKMSDPPVGDGNRLTIFVLPNETAVRKLAGDKSGFLRGFYEGRASGSVAFVPKRTAADSDWDIGTETLFFHEYAHHLMMQELSNPYPEWVVEGFAEFLSTAKFERDGSVGLGAPAKHRAWGLLNGRPLAIETLLGVSYSKISNEERESIYGRGWLLVHYLLFEPDRRGQLDRYIAGLSRGVPPLDSARQAFGDLKVLDRELNGYLKRRRLSYLKVAPHQLQPSLVEVRPLSQGAAEVILLRAQSKRGVDHASAGPLAARLRQVQARFPGDELVEVTLAEAELDADNYQAAQAAADRALKANARNTEAMILKGRAIVESASDATEHSSAPYVEARKWFLKANKIDPEDPEPLMEFYWSFLRQGVRPTDNAIEALHYASNLAPQDLGLRLNSAMAHLQTGKLAEARRTLAPVAYSPHGGGASAAAQRMIAKIDAGDPKGAVEAGAREHASE